MLSGHENEERRQVRIDLAAEDLLPGCRRERELAVGQQRRVEGYPLARHGGQGALIRRAAVGIVPPDVDPGVPAAEAGDESRGIDAQAGTELTSDGGSGHYQGAAKRVIRLKPERDEVGEIEACLGQVVAYLGI